MRSSLDSYDPGTSEFHSNASTQFTGCIGQHFCTYQALSLKDLDRESNCIYGYHNFSGLKFGGLTSK